MDHDRYPAHFISLIFVNNDPWYVRRPSNRRVSNTNTNNNSFSIIDNDNSNNSDDSFTDEGLLRAISFTIVD